MLENATSDDMIKIIDHMKDIITPIGIEVYNVYYKQMLYTGIFETLIDVLIILGVPIGIYYLIKHKDIVSRFYTWFDDRDLEMFIIIPLFILACVIVLLLINVIDCFPDDIMHILNPDYYIIQNLLHG